MLDQLPTLTEQTRTTALSLEQITFEEACRTEAAPYMALAERRPLTLVEQKKRQAALLKARQACNALELADPRTQKTASPKLEEFEAYVAAIAAGSSHKILVFSEWVGMLSPFRPAPPSRPSPGSPAPGPHRPRGRLSGGRHQGHL